MEETIEKLAMELHLDKSKWILTKFGDVAIQQKQSVDRENTELMLYVKGEHMGSEDLHLREWGELTDEYLGPAFIRKFEKGDILYGSRRTYLRKVVIAPFSGITSNTTYVAKANEEKIDKRLLPYVMMSEGFTENSIRNSKGSVNPYINWKDIANYEFLLPPKEEQAKLAELLWAMDEVIEREKFVFAKLDRGYASLREKNSRNKMNNIVLGDHVNILSGYPFKSKLFNNDNIGMPLIRIRDIKKSKVETFYSGDYDTNFIISKGDLIIGMDGDFIMNFWSGPKALLNQRVLKITPKELKDDSILRYLNHYLQQELDRINRGAGATTVKHLSVKDVKMIKLPYPKNGINNVIRDLDLFTTSKIECFNKIRHSQSLQKSLINQVF